MGAVKLVLKKNKIIRETEYAAGEVVLDGACMNGFTPDDVEKGIQSQDIRVQADVPAPAPKPRAKKTDKTEE